MPRRGALQTAAARGRENEFVLLFCGNRCSSESKRGQKPCAAAGVKNTSSCYSSCPCGICLTSRLRPVDGVLVLQDDSRRKRGDGDSTLFTESSRVSIGGCERCQICPKALGNNRNARVTSWLDSAPTDISREQLVGALASCCLQQFFHPRRVTTDRRRASDRET